MFNLTFFGGPWDGKVEPSSPEATEEIQEQYDLNRLPTLRIEGHPEGFYIATQRREADVTWKWFPGDPHDYQVVLREGL